MPGFWEKYKKDVAQKAQSNIGIVTGLPSRICDGHHTLINFISFIINYLGDIIINLSKTINKHNSVKEKLDELWIHGFVHLLGGRHKSKKEHIKMKIFEKKIYKSIN